MSRAAVLIVALVASLAGACGDGEIADSSPTGPSGGSGSQSPGGGSCRVPGAPTSLAVSFVGSSNIVLTWDASDGATEYLIIVGTTPSSSNKLLTNAFSTRYPWSGVGAGTYYARVQATNSCGTSGSSNEVSFTITG